jgi:hypothetical protein
MCHILTCVTYKLKILICACLLLFPPFLPPMSTLLHSLVLVLSPVSQVFEQSLQGVHSPASGHDFSLQAIASVSDPGQRVARTSDVLVPGISQRRRRIFSPPPQVRLQSPHEPHSVQAETRAGKYWHLKRILVKQQSYC